MSEDTISSAQLQTLLLQMTMNNTEIIKAAENTILNYLTNSSCVAGLMELLIHSVEPSVRQLSAIYLRKKIGLYWKKKLKSDLKVQIKNALLNKLIAEPVRVIRYAVAGVVATIAKIEVPLGKWNELLNFLLEGTQHVEISHRETSMLLFRALADTIGSSLKPHFSTLQEIFLKGLSDPQSAFVRSESLKALGRLLDHVEDSELMSFRKCIPPMIQALQNSLNEDDEMAASTAFEVFDELASSEIPIINPHIPVLVRFMLEQLVNTKLGWLIRSRAKNLICSIVCCKPKKISANNLSADIIKACMMLAVEPKDEDNEYDDLSAPDFATELLDLLTTYLDPEPIYTSCKMNVLPMIRSSDELHRYGGLLVLSELAQHCDEFLVEDLAEFVPIICSCINDPVFRVREGVVVTLSQFAEYLQPMISVYASEIIPCLLQSFDSLNKSTDLVIVGKTNIAIQTYLLNLEISIDPFLEPIMSKMSQLLTIQNPAVQRSSVQVISAVAAAAKSKFIPYFPSVIEMLMQMLTITDQSHLRIRAKATECIGNVALACGREYFDPYFERTFAQITGGFSFDFAELREDSYLCIGALAEVYGAQFERFLAIVLPLIQATLYSDEGVTINDSKDDIEHGHIGSDSESGEDAEEERMAMNGANFADGYIDEKSAALNCLAAIAKHIGAAFFNYWDVVQKALIELIDHPHHFVRQGVITAYVEVLLASSTAFPMAQPHTRGNFGVHSKETIKLFEFILPQLMFTLDDLDLETTAQVVDAFAKLFEVFGAGCMVNQMVKLQEQITSYLNEEAPCQATNDEEADADAKTSHDFYLLEATSDFIEVLSKVMAPSDFHGFCAPFIDPLMKFFSSSRPDLDISCAVGISSILVEGCGVLSVSFLNRIFPEVVGHANSDEIQVSQNIAFFIGVAFMNAPTIAPQFADGSIKALLYIVNMYNSESDDKSLRVLDNCTASFGRVMFALNSYPADILNHFVNLLPAKADFVEANNIYLLMIKMFETIPDQMMSHLPKIIFVLSCSLQDERVDLNVRTQLAHFTKLIFQQAGNQLQSIVATFPPENQSVLMSALNN